MFKGRVLACRIVRGRSPMNAAVARRLLSKRKTAPANVAMTKRINQPFTFILQGDREAEPGIIFHRRFARGRLDSESWIREAPGPPPTLDKGCRVESAIPSLIAAAERGEGSASEALFSALYAELHQLAKRELARPGGTCSLGVTTLLHEAYLDIAGRDAASFPDRAR